jgi:hypothetical protein
LVGSKKPNVKEPPSETMVAPGESSLPGTSRSLHALNCTSTRTRAAVQHARDNQSMGPSFGITYEPLFR